MDINHFMEQSQEKEDSIGIQVGLIFSKTQHQILTEQLISSQYPNRQYTLLLLAFLTNS